MCGPPRVLPRVCSCALQICHKLMLEPHRATFCVPLRHWKTSHASPKLQVTPRRSTADLIALDIRCFTALLDGRHPSILEAFRHPLPPLQCTCLPLVPMAKWGVCICLNPCVMVDLLLL